MSKVEIIEQEIRELEFRISWMREGSGSYNRLSDRLDGLYEDLESIYLEEEFRATLAL